MLKIRLSRIGARQRPFYRVVVMDERSKRSGAYIELLGTYNPLTHPHEVKLKQDRIDHWIKQGAQMSDGFLRIIGKAPQRPPRKSKKVKESSAVSPQPSDKTEEKLAENQPAKEGADVATSADQSVSEQGEADQSAQAMTSTTSDEPVASDASLTGENGNVEPTNKTEK